MADWLDRKYFKPNTVSARPSCPSYSAIASKAAAATPSGGGGSTPHAGVGFREALLRSDASVGRAVARIERLLAEPGLPEYAGPGMDIMIERELCAIMGSAVHGFAATFAHVCKLDYLLRFVRAMEKYALDSGRKPRAMVGAFVALLCRVVTASCTPLMRWNFSGLAAAITVSA